MTLLYFLILYLIIALISVFIMYLSAFGWADVSVDSDRPLITNIFSVFILLFGFSLLFIVAISISPLILIGHFKERQDIDEKNKKKINDKIRFEDWKELER